MRVEGLDHLVLTVASIERSCDLYVRVLGCARVMFAGGRTALTFGSQKINLHEHGRDICYLAFTEHFRVVFAHVWLRGAVNSLVSKAAVINTSIQQPSKGPPGADT